MSEEDKEEINEIEKAEKEISNDKLKSNRKPMYIALSVIGAVVLGALLFLIFRSRESGGQPVPAPRTVSFEPNGNEQSSVAAGD